MKCNWNFFPFVTLAALTISITVGCSSSSHSSTHANSVRIMTEFLPLSLGLPFGANGSPSTLYWHALFNTLTEWSVDNQLSPALASSWEQRDPLTWVFTIRPGVRFSNGDILNAESVSTTLNWLVNSPRGKSTLWGRELNSIKRTEADSEKSLIIYTSRPDPLIPNKLSGVFITHPSAFSDTDATDTFAREPIGTGPFILENWRDSKGQTLMRSAPESWRRPSFSTLILITAPNAMSRLQAVATGQADLVANISAELVADAESVGLTLHRIKGAMVSSFMFRTVENSESPVNDVRVRQALNYAINKEKMAILVGISSPLAGQGAPSFVNGHNPKINSYPYDAERARSLLADAGYANGLDLSLTVNTTDQTQALLAQQVAQDAAVVGIKLTLIQTNRQQWLQKYNASSFDTDLFNLTWNSAPINDAARPLRYTSCLRSNPFFCEDSIVPLIERIQVELDEKKRLSMLQEAQALIHQLAPAIFMFETIITAVSGPKIKNIHWRHTVPAYDLMKFNGPD